MNGEVYSRAIRVRAFVDGRCRYDRMKEFLLSATGKQAAVEILGSLISGRVMQAVVVLPLDVGVALKIPLARVVNCSIIGFHRRFAKAIVNGWSSYRVYLMTGGVDLDMDKPLVEQGAADWPKGQELKLIVAKVI